MPSEKILRQDLRQYLATQGWICWFSPRVKFLKQQDIFTMWDGVKAKGNEVVFIQFTTKANRTSHIKKILDYRKLYNLSHKGELWLYDSKKREWNVEVV